MRLCFCLFVKKRRCAMKIKPVLILVWLLPLNAWAADGLGLQDAVKMAMDSDPGLQAQTAQIQAFRDDAIAADGWPDPRLALGLRSLPVDSFKLDQEPMTQVVVGYQQMLPRGDTSAIQSRLQNTLSEQQQSSRANRQRMIQLSVTQAWLKVYLQEMSENILRGNRKLFSEQVKISRALYAAGRKQQQNVLQAELELSLVDDKLHQVHSNIKQARAELAEWVGNDIAALPLQLQGDEFNHALPPDQQLKRQLLQHPLLQQKQKAIQASEAKVGLANTRYSPQWGFDVSYGFRQGNNVDGSDRADFFSAIVSLDLPVFTENRQDRQVSSAKARLLASRYDKQDLQRQLQTRLETALANWDQLQQRLKLYQQQVLPQSQQNAEAAMNGYQSGVVSFFTLTGARSAELKARLQQLQLQVEQARVYAQIHYLVGDT